MFTTFLWTMHFHNNAQQWDNLLSEKCVPATGKPKGIFHNY